MAGLTLACTGVFIANSAGSSYVGSAATESRASAVGLYVTFYYLGGSGGGGVPGFFLSHGGGAAGVGPVFGGALAAILLVPFFFAPPSQVSPVPALLPPAFMH